MKITDIVSKAIATHAGEIDAGLASAMAKAPATSAPKAVISAGAEVDTATGRLQDLAFIVKSIRGGALTEKDKVALSARAKAVGVTGDITELLPDGFSGSLLRDLREHLRVAKLFPMGTINGGTAHDIITTYGIEAFLTAEATDGTDSSENYITFVKTTQKISAIVRKSYEALDDALIDLASEVRAQLLDSIARGIEKAVINGDISNTMDTGVAANSPQNVCNGLRKAALGKATVDFTGASLTEDQWLAKINEMQLAGGLYLDSEQVAMGNVVLIVPEAVMYMFRTWTSFKTLDKAGRVATLFGGEVNSIFGIPVISTSMIPKTAASGKIEATGNDFYSVIMVNINTFKLFSNGVINSETDKNIVNETVIYKSSLRFGFSSQFDSTEAAPNTIVGTYKNAVLGRNIAV